MPLFILGSQLALTAAGELVKKAFEAGAGSITASLRERFRGNEELLALKDELARKSTMLAFPIDACSHRVAAGNTVRTRVRCPATEGLPHRALLRGLQALQEALGVALSVLQDIESFRLALVQQDIARVRCRLRPAPFC